MDQWTWKPSPRSIGFDADENGQSRQAHHIFPIGPVWSHEVVERRAMARQHDLNEIYTAR
jgi:hypothetical protein